MHNNRQVWPRSIQNEGEKRLTEFCQETMPVIENNYFQQLRRQLYTGTSPDYQY